jgi:hypothetical protein
MGNLLRLAIAENLITVRTSSGVQASPPAPLSMTAALAPRSSAPVATPQVSSVSITPEGDRPAPPMSMTAAMAASVKGGFNGPRNQ